MERRVQCTRPLDPDHDATAVGKARSDVQLNAAQHIWSHKISPWLPVHLYCNSFFNKTLRQAAIGAAAQDHN
jgi:hypothetical protein